MKIPAILLSGVLLALATPGIGSSESRAEPMVTQGIGLSNCAKLAADLKPGEGLKIIPNIMMYVWAQGYISAANISLLEDDSKHIDIGALDETTLLNLVVDYCTKNPNGKPISALDQYIRKAKKINGKWESGTVVWDD